jgi:hypothetical protein
LFDSKLKAVVAGMKQEAKAKFSEMVNMGQNREFWRPAKCLVELSNELARCTIVMICSRQNFLRPCQLSMI